MDTDFGQDGGIADMARGAAEPDPPLAKPHFLKVTSIQVEVSMKVRYFS